MDEQDYTLGCCGPGVDMEMKNAVAIQRNAAAIAAIVKSLGTIEVGFESMKSNIDSMKATVDEWRESIDSIKASQDRLETNVGLWQSKIDEIAASQTAVVEKCDALNVKVDELSELPAKVEDVESGVTSIQNKQKEDSEKVDALSAKLAETNQALLATQGNLSDLKARVDEISEENAALKEEVRDSIDSFKEDVEELVAQQSSEALEAVTIHVSNSPAKDVVISKQGDNEDDRGVIVETGRGYDVFGLAEIDLGDGKTIKLANAEDMVYVDKYTGNVEVLSGTVEVVTKYEDGRDDAIVSVSNGKMIAPNGKVLGFSTEPSAQGGVLISPADGDMQTITISGNYGPIADSRNLYVKGDATVAFENGNVVTIEDGQFVEVDPLAGTIIVPKNKQVKYAIKDSRGTTTTTQLIGGYAVIKNDGEVASPNIYEVTESEARIEALEEAVFHGAIAEFETDTGASIPVPIAVKGGRGDAEIADDPVLEARLTNLEGTVFRGPRAVAVTDTGSRIPVLVVEE